jgi:hypothetical protein
MQHVEDVIARRIYPRSDLRKAAQSAAQSRGFTAMLVTLALAAVVIVLGMIAFTAGEPRTDTMAANVPQERLANSTLARSD